jgi:hypothetical protein
VERRKLYIEVSGVRIILLLAHGLEDDSNQGSRGAMLPPNTWRNADISKEKQDCDANRKSTEGVR